MSTWTPDERRAATVLYRALSAARAAFDHGERDADHLCASMTEMIEAEPLAKLHYVSCANPKTLVELSGPVENALLSMAVHIGTTRLIDNFVVGQTRDQ